MDFLRVIRCRAAIRPRDWNGDEENQENKAVLRGIVSRAILEPKELGQEQHAQEQTVTPRQRHALLHPPLAGQLTAQRRQAMEVSTLASSFVSLLHRAHWLGYPGSVREHSALLTHAVAEGEAVVSSLSALLVGLDHTVLLKLSQTPLRVHSPLTGSVWKSRELQGFSPLSRASFLWASSRTNFSWVARFWSRSWMALVTCCHMSFHSGDELICNVDLPIDLVDRAGASQEWLHNLDLAKMLPLMQKLSFLLLM
ncbi:hypothetical protein CRUP_013628 [Coryphaenoides rupestris]|nr:hypothetical protein CRUP_013628 [Coryphaenoides rupestris]